MAGEYSKKFRELSDRLENAISPSLIKVAGKLSAKGLIAQATRAEATSATDANAQRIAIKIVNELQIALDEHDNPKTFLNEVCEALKLVGEERITNIVDKLQLDTVPTVTVQPNSDTSHTTTTTESQKKLTIKDLDEINTVLVDEAFFGPVKWNDFGLKLGLLQPRLNVIKDEGGDAFKLLKRTIEVWLEGQGKETRTWQTLINAVKDAGDRAAAERIPGILKSRQT